MLKKKPALGSNQEALHIQRRAVDDSSRIFSQIVESQDSEANGAFVLRITIIALMLENLSGQWTTRQ
jgi:hypothetical protein